MKFITQSTRLSDLPTEITAANLEKVPVENRRPIYSNLIKFVELHPTKIKLGVYAPLVREGSYSVRSGAEPYVGRTTDMG